MTEPAAPLVDSAPAAGWNTGSHDDFFKYYEKESASPRTLQRFRDTCDTLLRVYGAAAHRVLDVVDVGCGAGAPARAWLDHGHRYWGIDINEPLITLARERAVQFDLAARFDVASATALPCADASMDICMLPELLEHVADWQSCVAEAVRVLRPNGLLYINTSSKLCPKQQEFALPLYSWYPAPLKRHIERRAVTDWPAVANFATYPAVNWFSFYQLRDHLAPLGFSCQDRFDLIEGAKMGSTGRAVLGTVRTLAPLRWLGHVATPYTLLVGRKG